MARSYVLRRPIICSMMSRSPGAQIYGFFAYPPLALANKRVIESTQLRGVLLGVEFHGWSRHRGPAAPWNPAVDNVVSQLALVDAALAKEVGE
jgi:hypothetical protein